MLLDLNGSLIFPLAQTATAATAKTNLTWLLSRDFGVITYLLATASVLLGLSTTTRTADRAIGRGALYDSHRALALLTLIALAGHIIALALDTFAQFSVPSLLIPFSIWYRPFWSSLGIIAAYGIVAVYFSFYIRDRIGYRTWRSLHYITFVVFILATIHGFTAGTDGKATWSVLMYVTTVLAVGGMLTYRMMRGKELRPRWAWLTEFGDEGAARLAVGTATVVGAAFLVGVLVLTSGSKPSSTAAFAEARAQEAPIPDAPPTPTTSVNRQQEEEQEQQQGTQEEQQSATVQFTGTSTGSGWRLASLSLRGTELDLDSTGQFVLIRTDTGETIFQASQPVIVSGSQGSVQSTMDGVGTFTGRTLSIDGTYVVSGGRVSLTGTVVLTGSASR